MSLRSEVFYTCDDCGEEIMHWLGEGLPTHAHMMERQQEHRCIPYITSIDARELYKQLELLTTYMGNVGLNHVVFNCDNGDQLLEQLRHHLTVARDLVWNLRTKDMQDGEVPVQSHKAGLRERHSSADDLVREEQSRPLSS